MASKRLFIVALAALSLGGCGYAERFREIGKEPKLSAIENPVIKPGYRPISMPMPAPEPASYNPNSLWRNGARAFFKDQRAARIGDILTVIVEISDKAEIENATKRSRDNTEAVGFDALVGGAKKLQGILPSGVDFSKIVDVDSAAKSDGTGSIDREETVTTKIAAVVTQQLPNGNMVIEGRQEVRVNFEMREMKVAGVVRPEDITSDNTVPFSKIAEARVSYGGRGRISEVQQPRYGQQVMDIVLPW